MYMVVVTPKGVIIYSIPINTLGYDAYVVFFLEESFIRNYKCDIITTMIIVVT